MTLPPSTISEPPLVYIDWYVPESAALVRHAAKDLDDHTCEVLWRLRAMEASRSLTLN